MHRIAYNGTDTEYLAVAKFQTWTNLETTQILCQLFKNL
jgi:hypothetical protein